MRKICLLAVVLLLGGCAGAPPKGMSWDDYYSALHRLHQTHDRAAVTTCTELGSVSGRSLDTVGEAKDIAMDKAVRKGADTIYFGEIDARPNWHNYVVTRQENVYDVYGTAYRCN